MLSFPISVDDLDHSEGYLQTTAPVLSLLAGSPRALNCCTPNLVLAEIATLPVKLHDVAGPVIVHVAAVVAYVRANGLAVVTSVKTCGLVGAFSRFADISVTVQGNPVKTKFNGVVSVDGVVIWVRAFVCRL